MIPRGRNFSQQEIEVVRLAWKHGINDAGIVALIEKQFGIVRTPKSVSMIRRKYRIVGLSTRKFKDRDVIPECRKQDDKFRGAMLTALESGREVMPEVPPVSTKPHYIPVVNAGAQLRSQSVAGWCADLGAGE